MANTQVSSMLGRYPVKFGKRKDYVATMSFLPL